MTQSGMKKTIPPWVGVAAAVVVLLIIGVAGYRMLAGGGPRDKSTFPPEAFKAPGYSARPGAQATRYGQGAAGADQNGAAPAAPGTGTR